MIMKEYLKAEENVKAVLTSLNMASLPISCSRFKQRQILTLKTLTSVLRFCANLLVGDFGQFGKEIHFFLKW